MAVPATRILVGVTGASGAIYAERLIAELLAKIERVYLITTEAGVKVARHELHAHEHGFSLVRALDRRLSREESERLRIFAIDDLFAPVASGSAAAQAMIVTPCSMGTLSRISTGASSNLLERAADVMLKQKRPLLLCPRETPLSAIHLDNMAKLAHLGVSIVPAMPAFYQQPKSIDDMVNFVVGRILELLDIEHTMYKPWNARML